MAFEIKISDEGFNNIYLLHANDEKFTISINGNAVSLPLNVAALVSSTVTKILLADSSSRNLDIVIDFRNYENIQKLVSILSSKTVKMECSIPSKNDAMDFAEFGYYFGNEAFLDPFLMFIKKESDSPLSIDNVIDRIREKDLISLIYKNKTEISCELLFIEKHFSEVIKNESFVDWCLQERNSSRVEEIIRSSSFYLSCEDDLLSFLIRINSDLRFTYLFRYVHLEFCSISKCRDFIEYINNDKFFQFSVFRDSIINCISNRLLYDSLKEESFSSVDSRYTSEFFNGIVNNSTMHLNKEIATLRSLNNEKDSEIEKLKSSNNEKDSEIEKLRSLNNEKDSEIATLRSSNNEKDSEIEKLKSSNNEKDSEIEKLRSSNNEVNSEDTKMIKQNEILKSEHKKGNVLIESTPSTLFGRSTPYILIEEENRKSKSDFYLSIPCKNPYLQASLKDGKSFIVYSYSLCNKKYDGPENWKLFGQLSSNREWIQIDYQNNIPINDHQIHKFDVECKEKLRTVKFVMEGKNKDGDNCLCLDSFEIYGSLVD